MKLTIRTISSELYTPHLKKLQMHPSSVVLFDTPMTLYQNKLHKEYPSINTIRPRV